MSKVYINVFFSSNSQLKRGKKFGRKDVKGLYQCFLFKQFTTHDEFVNFCLKMSKVYINVFFSSNSQPNAAASDATAAMSKVYINVFFSSNSQLVWVILFSVLDVKGLYQCFLFKQFTTINQIIHCASQMSKVYINVFFSSNSQPADAKISVAEGCQRSISMFSFQAIHNYTFCI